MSSVTVPNAARHQPWYTPIVNNAGLGLWSVISYLLFDIPCWPTLERTIIIRKYTILGRFGFIIVRLRLIKNKNISLVWNGGLYLLPHYIAAFRGKPLSRACRMRQIAFCRLWYHIAKCAADAKSVTNLAKYIINETEMQESVREAANCRESLGCLRVILGCLCDRKLYVPVLYIRKFVSRSAITGCSEREYVRPRRHIIEYIGSGGARLFSPRKFVRTGSRAAIIYYNRCLISKNICPSYKSPINGIMCVVL